ncbi:CidA/LrgA family protein [Aneurinibacillus aneurinilyticus]|uniref:CidA/LrgA family holin-like protein n=2 Tax=Aneurinibacillus aneurinilyticus TaxID=1391 RepID=A0A848CN28_ANEAE|nr:CidA/LrgA family holin-like protein [Aneurinibacillus aneurinilyticus]MCI1693367.1 CidA/LrgA family holin-like protein [Aneurinibacillus aneurinilyticus]MED0671445.1 CidA/LrgA family holin-like protein [Aneurinibacillus aneurinilyticus]MED0707547.1 CidA/LrgA family holin-like protein [Aneurinibacillus aneurinilyticus]MED0723915.1 CidA/LrgA family holin-like protein [Aneurinibacillus aneurinilyticus]MED0731751.1 CidA/LrgA family holin-like protein [Aneurinibacillus aneurinilyticus]
MVTIMKGMGQIILLCVFSLIMNKFVEVLHWKIPGSILGIIVIFVLLQTKIIRLEWIELGAKWLLAELLLFFIPSAVGIIKYQHILVDNGVRVVFVITLSTIIVMACTGLLANKIAERKEQKSS